MKNATVTTTTVQAPALKVEAQETIRPLATVETDFSFDGDRVTLKKGAQVTPSEFALFIANRETKAQGFKTQARWAYYEAGRLPNGTEVQAEIAKRLREMLSQSAFNQLTSEAKTLCPLIVTEGIKTPLSTLKDAMGALQVNEATGKLLPLAKQSKAGKALIPLLKAGTVTQAKVRAIRKDAAPAPASKGNGKPSGKASADAGKTMAFGNALGDLKRVSVYLEANRVEGDDRKQFVTVLCDIGRKLGLNVAEIGAK